MILLLPLCPHVYDGSKMTRTIAVRRNIGLLGWAAALLLQATPSLSRAELELPATPTLATCGEDSSTEERPPWGRLFYSRSYSKQTFTPRAEPATEIKATELEMLQQGYVAIGWLEITRFTVLFERYKSP